MVGGSSGGEEPYSLAARAAAELATLTGVERHDVFVALGSGWSHASDLLPGGVDVPMVALPGFAMPSVPGHGGSLRSLMIGQCRVLLALGRVHLYEGHGPTTVVHAVRTAAAAGCRTVVLTNAAGAIAADLEVGRPVVLRDQINMTGTSALAGPPPPAGYPARFADMTTIYSPPLRALALEVEPGLAEGVYIGFQGPEFETPAEIRAARVLGADLCGMSTVLEAIAAAHLGLGVLGLSLVTNRAAGLGEERLSLEHVLAVAEASGSYAADVLCRVITRLAVEASGGMAGDARTGSG
jgi:purine-nucleoside phosphorylase